MEKVAVDKENDPVEKRAREIEKKGNLNRARQQAAEEINGRNRKDIRKKS